MFAKAALALALMAMPAFSQDFVDASDPEAILTAARGFGSAELTKDSSGDPHIQGRMEGEQYAVTFYGCEDGANCSTLQFSSGWDLDGVTPDAINEWNRTKRFGKAYLDGEGEPWIEMDVNLAFGVTPKNLDDTFDWWRTVVAQFKDEVLER